MWGFEANQKPTEGRAASPRCRWSSSISLCVCRKMTAKGEGGWPQLGAGKSQGAISSRKDDVGRWKQPSRVERCLHRQPGPAGMKLSVLQELHPELPSPKGTEWILTRHEQFSTLSLPNCCCPAHFNVYGKLFSSRCSYLELNNCLQLYEHHVKNTNKGTKNLCSIMLCLPGAKTCTETSTHGTYRHSSLGFCLSKSSTKLWTPLIFRLF